MNLTLSKKTLVTMTLACCAIIFRPVPPFFPPFIHPIRTTKEKQNMAKHLAHTREKFKILT